MKRALQRARQNCRQYQKPYAVMDWGTSKGRLDRRRYTVLHLEVAMFNAARNHGRIAHVICKA